MSILSRVEGTFGAIIRFVHRRVGGVWTSRIWRRRPGGLELAEQMGLSGLIGEQCRSAETGEVQAVNPTGKLTAIITAMICAAVLTTVEK